jgi:hypothetical protein
MYHPIKLQFAFLSKTFPPFFIKMKLATLKCNFPQFKAAVKNIKLESVPVGLAPREKQLSEECANFCLKLTANFLFSFHIYRPARIQNCQFRGEKHLLTTATKVSNTNFSTFKIFTDFAPTVLHQVSCDDKSRILQVHIILQYSMAASQEYWPRYLQ